MSMPDEDLIDLKREIAELRHQLEERDAALAEAAARESATAEMLRVINASPGDLAPVFDAMLHKAMRLCDASFGELRVYDGKRFRSAALHGVPSAFADYQRNNTWSPQPGSLGTRVLAGEQVMHVPDLKDEPTYREGDPYRRALVDLGGARTALVAALRKDDKVLGYIIIYRQEVRPFSDKQVALLQNFAAQAVIAMENGRLITETREALERQTAVSEVLEVISSSPGQLQPVFDAVIANAVRICGGTFGLLGLWENDGFRGVATSGVGAIFADTLSRIHHPPLGTSLNLAQVTKETVHQLDCATDPAYNPVRAFNPDFAQVRTNLTVPMLRQGDFLGALAIYRNEVQPFDPKQVELVENFAAQAAIAMENARLITETREALEQQTATAEVLGVINSSPGNLALVFEAMLQKAMTLCDAAFGELCTYNGEAFHTAAVRNVPEAYAARLYTNPRTFAPGTGPARMVAGERVLFHVDLKDEEPYRRGDPNRRALVDLGGARSALQVVLLKDDSFLGFITLFRQEVRPFSEKQTAFLQNFAAQAVIAMENARLITETREALEQQTATAEVLRVINSSPGDLAPVFDAILEKAHSLCGVTYGSLQLYDGERFRAAAVHDLPVALAEQLREGYRPHPDLPNWRLLEGESFAQVADIAEVDHPIARTTSENGIRTLLWVALRKEDVLLGSIAAARTEVRPFTNKQIALLQNFAAQAVIAMENARLLGELRQRTKEVAELNRGLEARVAEQVEELGRVGRLKRFLAPQLAELIVSQGDEKILESHRREIVVVFCDLRGYTAFTETAEPEEVLDFLREYHGALGPLVSQFEGTLDQFAGDGIMVFFNDPVPIPDPASRAVNMAVAMREAASTLIADWRERGRDLGFGAGIAQGYATLGQIGFSERSGYTAIGTVCNVAARLCAEAEDGQILLSQRVNAALKGSVSTEQVGALALKGLTQPVLAYNVPLAAAQAALRVIEGGAPNA